MSTMTIAMRAHPEVELGPTEHARYIGHRVIDALLREDVRACVSGGTLVSKAMLPSPEMQSTNTHDTWLKVAHFGGGCLWIPVVKSSFMQEWRSAGLPLLWQIGDQVRKLYTVEDIIACFGCGLSGSAASLFNAFAEECRVAIIHRQICEQERERWFAELHTCSAAKTSARLTDRYDLLHYDRLGAFLDHPLYPTARAKLGFDKDALVAYSPEFQRSFQLRWLAVPRSLYYPSIANELNWPTLWPGFEDVGLKAELAQTHALVPIHPFVWGHQLDIFLAENSLRGQVIFAPNLYLNVTPTLSVRTVVLLDAPEWHLKLPLTIRTLGARNIRTIKPSTIQDGHTIQALLGAIAAREPGIKERLLLTDEECGAHVDHRNYLGYILRRYPTKALHDSILIPVAALMAQTPDGKLVAEEVAEQFYEGDFEAFFHDYLDLTLRVHLLLWLRYGIALESNQQNSVVVLSQSEPRLRLLLKDNDAARIDLDYLRQRWPQLASQLAGLRDERIVVTESLPLAQMFTTITLQLNIAVLVERFAAILDLPSTALYAQVRQSVEMVLAELSADGENIALARRVLLEDDRLYIKYLLTAATLAEKTETGADDVNKFYGRSAPNFLRSV